MFSFVTENVLPVQIIKSEGNLQNSKNLLVDNGTNIWVREDNVCTINGKGYIVFDFGKEYHGGARILTHITSLPQVEVRLRFGESLSETFAEIGEKGACNDHSIRDFKTLLTSYSDMTFAQTGFRFLRIDFLTDANVSIKNVYCAYTHRKFPDFSPFYSKDERISEIFNVAKRTVELCCQSQLWDGIKRDRLVWIGDIHPEMLALTSLYGKMPIIENALTLSKNQYPLGTWMNDMPMYSAWWAIIMADYCKLCADYELAKENEDYLQGIIKQCSKCVKEDGSLDFESYFVDWATHGKEDEIAGCRALLTIMTNKFIELASVLSLDATDAKNLLKKLDKQPIRVKSAKQVVALKYFAQGRILDEEIKLITKGGAQGLSTFMSYYVLKTVAKTYSIDYAIQMLKDYYGAMLDKGATTFFEDFDMAWVQNTNRIDTLAKDGEKDIHGDFGAFCYKGYRHSLCHGWSGGVIKFLYEYCNELSCD